MKVMRLVAASAAAALALATAPSLAASNIDQGFAHDGSTTYCQGIKPGPIGAVPGLAELQPSSAGKCPVGVTITATGTVAKGEKLSVTWKAKANTAVQNNLFPSSVDVASKVPKAVASSWLKACKAGTNCATVIDATATGPANQDYGDFDASGSKELRTNEFTFTEAAEYVIIGKVMLPGDDSLGAKSIEYIAMLKIKVVDATPTPTPTPTSGAPTPSPVATPTAAPSSTNGTTGDAGANATSPSNSTSKNEDNVMKTPTTDSGAGTVKPGSSDVAGGSNGSDTTSVDARTTASNGIFGSNSVLLGCVFAGCFVAFVMGFVFVMRRRTESRMAHDKHGPPDTHGSVGMLDSGEFGAAKYVANTTARNQEPAAPEMSASPAPIVVFDASVRGSELLNLSADEFEMQQRDVSEVSSLASEAYSDTVSTFDAGSRQTNDDGDYLGSFDWKESEDSSRQSNFSIASKARGFSTASALSDLSEGPRESRLASEVSVDSYAFAPSPRSSATDSYAFAPSPRSSATDSYAFAPSPRSSATDSYAFAPSPRSSAADSYLGGYSESSRISAMSMYSDVSSVHNE